MKEHAPKMINRTIPNEFIGALIGPGGKVIQELQKESGCTIVINEDPNTEEGIVEILGTSPERYCDGRGQDRFYYIQARSRADL